MPDEARGHLLCIGGDSSENLAPLIFKWIDIFDSERTVEGIRFLWSGTSMLQKIRLVSSHQNILTFLPFEHEETVSPCLFEHHQNAHQVRKRLGMPSGNLLLAVARQLDIHKFADIELPRQPVSCLHLHSQMAAGLTRRDYVVMRNVSSERRRKKVEAAQLRRYQEFSNRACQLVGSTCCQILRYQPRTFSAPSKTCALCEDVYRRPQPMTTTLSIRIDSDTKKRLGALAKRSRRSQSFLAAEAIVAYVESEEWQLGELHAGMAELESGLEVSHENVSKWLKSWGKPGESKAPR